MRTSQITRKTNETDINLILNVDGTGKFNINTGCGFLDHMLALFARHGRFDLDITCKGDVYVDYHHTAEDIGICLGLAFKQALGEMKGITRYGDITLPMDETLMLCAIDISGRGYLGYLISNLTEKVGDFDTELVKEFFSAFIRSAAITLHFKQFSGENTHHIIEAMFKAFGRAMKNACETDKKYEDEIPSTKGVLQ